MKKLFVLLGVLLTFLFSANPAFAHVVVKPAEIGVGQRLNFAVSVPTEEDNPTVGVRLVVPDGVGSVRPNAKPGWRIELKKDGDKVTEINWIGGNIPVDLRDEFVFSAQAPATETNLIWKAYQTYSDGDVVAWEADPKTVEDYTKNNPPKEGEEDDHNAPKPFSVTKVVNDLKSTTPAETNGETEDGEFHENLLFVLVGLALLVSVTALGMHFRKGNK